MNVPKWICKSKKSTPLHGLNLLLSIHYLKTIIMRKMLFLSLLFSVFLMDEVLAQVFTLPHNVYGNSFVKNKKVLEVSISDKSLGTDLPKEYINGIEVYVHTKRGEFLLPNKSKINPRASFVFRDKETNQDVVEDTMVIEVKSPDYRGGKFIYYDAIHGKNTFRVGIALPKKDHYPNQIEVLGDYVEVILNRQSKFYDLKEFRQSEDEDVLTTLCRLPGFEVGKKEIKMEGEILTYFYINGEYEIHNSYFFPELLKRFNRSKKKLKK